MAWLDALAVWDDAGVWDDGAIWLDALISSNPADHIIPIPPDPTPTANHLITIDMVVDHDFRGTHIPQRRSGSRPDYASTWD